jgi:purine-binding chemotaxis protein CheW
MNDDAQATLDALATLRREFDAAFALAPQDEAARRENLLAIRVAGDGYALRVAQIAGLFADKAVTPLPTPVSELKGLAGFRGRSAPVYDLAALLGYPKAGKTRWLALARGVGPLALAFDDFESHFAVAADAQAGEIVRSSGATLKLNAVLRPQVFDAVRYQGTMRPIVDLDAIIESIRRRAVADVAPVQPGSTST